eukprot:TRINITY_DN1333_c0_g3_i1.p1 TRINITY_DN1333_c0_g3~~TRINITY_DN1333_c0_g3_i1.p1  ORF type:complete len:505 (-),score=55.26 TRINITY_DN1333_c0_g3_i1:726-2240(-)
MQRETRRVFDKQSLRVKYAAQFETAINTLSKQIQNSDFSSKKLKSLNYEAECLDVYIRKRPLFEHEKQNKQFDCVKFREDQIYVHDCRLEASYKRGFINQYKYTVCGFDENVDNESLCSKIQLAGMVDLAYQGGESTIFMFGQTGSGKTYTISAIQSQISEIIFAKYGDQSEINFEAIELCGNNAVDLLSKRTEVFIREDQNEQVHVQGCCVKTCSNQEQLSELLSKAAINRKTKNTTVNDTSSRTHAFYRILFPGCDGRLSLVDLAGSERNMDSRNHTADRRTEGSQINSTLAVLKNCIRQSQIQNINNNNYNTKQHVPFRESKLTMLLKNALLGKKARIKTKTILIATISPCSCDVEHTLNTLKNALLMQGAQDIENNTNLEKYFVELSNGQVFHENQENVLQVSHNNKQQFHHPRDWTPEMVQEWLQKLQNGRFNGTIKKNVSGKQMMTWGMAHFRNACDGDAKLAKKLFELFQKEKLKATKAREVQIQKKTMGQIRNRSC